MIAIPAEVPASEGTGAPEVSPKVLSRMLDLWFRPRVPAFVGVQEPERTSGVAHQDATQQQKNGGMTVFLIAYRGPDFDMEYQ